MRIRQISWLLVIMCSFGSVEAQTKAFSDTTVLFDPQKDGYSLLHVPAIVHTGKSTLLAFCEGRLGKGNDWSDMDLIMRRSTDNGNTWEPLRIIIPHSSGKPTSNITPIIDQNGIIHLLFQINYANAFYMQSADEGKTWTTPLDITYAFDSFREKYPWKVLAPGPGHAIQLRSGRLLVPVWLCIPDKSKPGGDHRPSCTATIYSDDHGKTWKAGSIIANNGDFASNHTTDTIINPNESVVAELPDGRVMINMRNESKLNRRLISISPDGISGWSKPYFDDALFEPVCMASMLQLTKNSDKNRLLFVNPDSRNNDVSLANRQKINKPRENLTAKLSYDDGKTWPVQKVLYEKGAGYSDLTTDGNGMVFCICEVRDAKDNVWNYSMIIRRFNLEWLTDGSDYLNKQKGRK